VFVDILLRQHEHKKAKLTVNFLTFSSVKFCKIWETVGTYCTVVGVKSLRQVFLAAVKDIYLKNSKKPAFTNPTFFVFEIRIPLYGMCCEN